MRTKSYEPYLRTLRRIPPEVRQSMATREFDMDELTSCVCGWALRDALLAATGVTSGDAGDWYWDTPAACVRRFGGTKQEWAGILLGVTYTSRLPLIETAFTIAVAETVRA